MADEELLKQDEKEQGKPKVVVNDGKWTPRSEIREKKRKYYEFFFFASLCSVTFIHGFTKCLLRSS